ncbi:MAG: DUF1501 domain-containing protein [Planctomycetota bacterium]
MNDAHNLTPRGLRLLNRRGFTQSFLGGGLSLMTLLNSDGYASDVKPLRPQIDPENPYAPRSPHFDMPAKKVLVINLPGAVSQVDTFDYKPALEKYHGKKPPGLPEVTFGGPTGKLHKPFWKFRQYGECGKMVSDLVPHLGALSDDLCFIHSMTSESSNHPQAENFLNTGFIMEGFPSFGAWTAYALGSENSELPAFISINDPRGMPRSGRNNWGNGFLPAAYQGTDFGISSPVKNLTRPERLSESADQKTVDLVKKMNDLHMERFPEDSDLAARIASYELAGRMQMSVPEVMDIRGEPEHIHKLYGTDSGSDNKRLYAQNCILARRLLERGVRVVQLFNGSDASGGNGITNWDSHTKMEKTHGMQGEIMDQPTAGLIADMKQRGMLEDTLVVWATEFGRTPFLQGFGTGRDHNPSGFTCFLAGAGVKKGFSYGESDEWGFKAEVDKVEMYDFNATILHLMGLDHERLSYYHNGIERRLTNVHGHVIKDVLA